jgi:trk system potassium uptake protein TrkH
VRLALVVGLFGRILTLFSIAFAAPAVLALVDGDGAAALRYLAGLAGTCGAGVLLRRAHGTPPALQRAETLLVVAGTWALVPAFAAIPFWLEGLSAVDGWFETMSGLTTTGASVLVDYSAHGRAFFLWRALLEWIGGYGIIAFFVLVLPHLAIGGRQLFFAEASSAPGERVSPQARRAARGILVFYVLMTAAQTALLSFAGMEFYDAVVHSMATLSTGGYSPNPGSVGGYGNAAAEWIVVAFMLVGGASFTLQWKWRHRPSRLLRDPEYRAYLAVFVAGTALVAFLTAEGLPTLATLRHAAFSVASLLTTTGFASADWNLWNDAARVVLVGAMLVGACAGSSGGGPKMVRYVILGRFLRRETTQALHPSAVIPIRWRTEQIASSVLRATVAVVVLYGLSYALFTGVLVLLGMDMLEGFTGAVACLNSVGPGLGQIGPVGSYGPLPEPCKWVLGVAMWLGRLEVLTVLVLLHPHAWRNARWKGEARAPGGAPAPVPGPAAVAAPK